MGHIIRLPSQAVTTVPREFDMIHVCFMPLRLLALQRPISILAFAFALKHSAAADSEQGHSLALPESATSKRSKTLHVLYRATR